MVNVADCPTLKAAEVGETETDGAAFIVTVIMFEVAVTGVVALSVTWEHKVPYARSYVGRCVDGVAWRSSSG